MAGEYTYALSIVVGRGAMVSSAGAGAPRTRSERRGGHVEQPDQPRERQRARSAGVGGLLRRPARRGAHRDAELRAAGAVAGARPHPAAPVREGPPADEPPPPR